MSFQDVSALLGLDERTRRLLDLRSYYAETQYETVVVAGNEIEARAWDDDLNADGTRVPARQRKPMIQIGTTAKLVDRLIDLALGAGRFPTFAVEEAAEPVRDALLDEDQIDLEGESPDHLTDLAVVGAACFGFVHPTDEDGFSRWEPNRIEPEWGEPIFAGARFTARALELAAELSQIEGVNLDEDEEGRPVFPLPTGARSDDVVFVRNQWPVAHEERAGAHAKQNVVVWYRVDYTADAIIEYAPVTARGGDQSAPDFRPYPVEPHNWGVVPLVWLPMRGGRRGESEGPSLYSASVRSLTETADYSGSFWAQASMVSGSPSLLEIDVSDEEQLAQLEATALESGIMEDIVAVGPRSVLRYKADAGSTKADVRYLEISGQGPKALQTSTEALTKAAHERARIPQLDPEKMSGVLSGVALERLNEPALALVGGYRARLERGWRLLAHKLATAMVAVGELPAGVEVSFGLSWPRVFPLTATDVKAWVDALGAAVTANLYSRSLAVAKLASLLEETENPEEILDEIMSEVGGSVPEILEPEQSEAE